MLIAIMGDTFAKVSENRSMYATQNRIAIMQDFSGNFKSPTKANLFLYVVSLQEENEDSESSWEGSINTLRLYQKQQFEEFESKFNKQIEKVIDSVETNFKREFASDKEVKDKLTRMISRNNINNKVRFDGIEKMIDTKVATLMQQ